MADLYHMFGNDLVAGPHIDGNAADPRGDLLTVGGHSPDEPGAGKTIQRLLRRLLTNPGEYLWNPNYGAGIARFLGQPTSVPAITAIIRSQIFLEAAVAQTPAPVITVTGQKDGSVFCSILYTDAATGKPTPLQFSIAA